MNFETVHLTSSTQHRFVERDGLGQWHPQHHVRVRLSSLASISTASAEHLGALSFVSTQILWTGRGRRRRRSDSCGLSFRVAPPT